MIRASQKALIQRTNLGLLDIRQMEINYYLSLNLAFGTQAALIGGFTYNVFTQQPFNEDVTYITAQKYVNDFCWLSSGVCIAFSIHVIIVTVLLQALGPGLALHGPVGSIVRATEGMRVEQKQIYTSFNYMIVFFAISSILSFWVVMSFIAATASTVCFVIAARFWWFHTERMLLRFHWNRDVDAWKSTQTGGGRNYNDADGELISCFWLYFSV